jgi:PAS domain S-box-containing protein
MLHPQGGKPFIASLSISPQCNVQNKTIGLLWLIRDITERKNMEEELKKSKTELSLILEQSPNILWTTNRDLKLTSMSGAGSASFSNLMTGSISAAEYFGPESGAILLEAHESALAGLSRTFDFEWQGRILQSTVEALRDTADRIIGVIGAAFDITERKNAEIILKKNEEFNAKLLQHSPNPISVINQDSSIAYVNPAFEKLTGFSADSVIGLKAPYPWWTVINAKTTEGFLADMNKQNARQEKLFRKNNGHYFWIESTTILIQNDESDYYLQTWVDVTEAKQLRQNLEFYVMQITKVQEEERKRIARDLHEEILQSLAALCLATEAIIKSEEQSPQSTLQDLNKIRASINGVIEEVRRFSYDLRPGVLDYLGLIAALETLTDELNKKGINAHLKVSGQEISLPPDIEITIFRIIQEALNNVKKHSLATKVNIFVYYNSTSVRLSITDNGKGFKIPKRLSELTNQGKLGIMGMEERTRMYGGNFSICSEPDKGTKITIRLPTSINLRDFN